jgi:hypothetical protein
MASAWKSSWGLSWLNSWGGTVQPETPQESGRYHDPPNPPRVEPPLYSPVMAACMLAVGAQLSGLAYSGSDDSTP